jgi:hypothetical protein
LKNLRQIMRRHFQRDIARLRATLVINKELTSFSQHSIVKNAVKDDNL